MNKHIDYLLFSFNENVISINFYQGISEKNQFITMEECKDKIKNLSEENIVLLNMIHVLGDNLNIEFIYCGDNFEYIKRINEPELPNINHLAYFFVDL